MQSLAALVRRGTGAQPAAACNRAASAPWIWETLRQGLSSLATGADAAGQQAATLPPAAASAASPAAAQQQRRPLQQQQRQRPRPTPLPDVAAEERAPALQLRRQMGAALAEQRYAEVLRLLYASEGSTRVQLFGGGEGPVAAAGAAAAAAQNYPAAAWHPYDRAALFDCALRACALRADPDEARRLVARMWKRQVPVGLSASLSVLQAHCALGQRREALAFLRRIPTKRQRAPMFTWLMAACNDAGDVAVGHEVLELFQRRQLAPDARLLAEAVRLHGAGGDLAAAEAALAEGRAAAAAAAAAAGGDGAAALPGAAEARLHAAWVGALAKAGRLEEAVAALEAMLDEFSSLLPVEVSVAARDSDGSGSGGSASSSDTSSGEAPQRLAWGEAGGGGVQQRREPSPVHLMQAARNAVLAAARERGDAAAGKHAASLATMRGLPPDVGTYNGLLRASLAHGDGLQAVLEGVEELRRLGMRPDWQTYALLLRACQTERDVAAAHEVFDGMPADGVQPTRLHYNACLSVHAAGGDLQGTGEAYQRMRAAGFPPDALTLKTLLEAVRQWAALEVEARSASEEARQEARSERVHQRQEASQLLHAWVGDAFEASRDLALTPGLFTAMLHAHSLCGDVWSVLLLMRDAFGVRLSPPTERLLGGPPAGGAPAAAACAKQALGGVATAAAVTAASAERGIGGAAAAAAGEAAAGEAAAAPGAGELDTLQVMASSSSSSGASAAELEAAAGGPEEAAAPLPLPPPPAGDGGGPSGPLSAATLRRAALAPSPRIFNAAISACTRVGHRHMADAVALLRGMLAGGLSPDVHTYTSLIAGCAYGRQAALARELLRQMQQRGIQPTAWTYNALLNVECWTYGVDAGAALLRSLVAQGMQPDRATWNTLLASARHFKHAGIAEMALAELHDEEQREEEAAAAAAAAAEERAQEAAAAAAAAGEPAPDHRWHGYYERQNQEDEDDW